MNKGGYSRAKAELATLLEMAGIEQTASRTFDNSAKRYTTITTTTLASVIQFSFFEKTSPLGDGGTGD